ncbi:hypothetical protein PUR_05820 [Paenibacillus sp. URB8-2]|nr:hypothetical protein PUR_05820 [Paenibacillus sp. URB8-2]
MVNVKIFKGSFMARDLLNSYSNLTFYNVTKQDKVAQHFNEFSSLRLTGNDSTMTIGSRDHRLPVQLTGRLM